MAAGALLAFITAAVYALLPPPLNALAAVFMLGGILGLVYGILIIIFGLLAYMKGNKMFGIIVLVIALINLIGGLVSFGADFFFIGSILSLLGGILIYIEK